MIEDKNTMQNPENGSIKDKKKLHKSLEDNVDLFKEIFHGDDTFYVRFFTNQEQSQARFCLLFINGMVGVETANRNIIQPVIQSTLPKDYKGNIESILNKVVLANNAEKQSDVDELVTGIIRGESVLLMEHCEEAFIKAY